MPVIGLIALLAIVYFGLKVLIPILKLLLQFFALLSALSPFILYIFLGIIIGAAIMELTEEDKDEDFKKNNFN
jgi:glucan phosphoethanolaminetransferase (alkaline phosphatase superfamily)